MWKIIFREGTREADRLLEDHKGAEAEAKKLKAGMDSSVSCWYFGWGIWYLEGIYGTYGRIDMTSLPWYFTEFSEFQAEKLTKARDRWAHLQLFIVPRLHENMLT